MLTVVDDEHEETIISLVTKIGDGWRGCRSEAETSAPTQETLETRTIGSIRVAPPGLRRICQFGDDSGLENVLYYMDWQAMLPQCTQCKECLSAHHQQLIDMRSEGKLPSERYAKRFD